MTKSISGNQLTISGTLYKGVKNSLALPEDSVQDLAGKAMLQSYTLIFPTRP